MKVTVPTGPNRAQRRFKAKQDRREERAKQRLALLRSYEDLLVYMASTHELCQRCGLHFLGNSWYRCQCQVQQCRQCAICHRAFMASQRVWRATNVCKECTKQLGKSRANEEASRSAAYDAWYERRAWDDAQHREAMEAQ